MNWNKPIEAKLKGPDFVPDPDMVQATILGDAEANRYNYLPIPIDQQNKGYNLTDYYPILLGGGVLILLIFLFKR